LLACPPEKGEAFRLSGTRAVHLPTASHCPDLEAIMKALPIGISTFSKVIREDYAYVDKTGYIRTLADKGKL
jgi:hypothetical protein